MSFLKYIESKASPRAQIVMDAYQETLTADLASLLIKPDEKIEEIRKYIINFHDISRTLSELKYPLANELEIAIRSGNAKKVSHAHMTFRRWTEYSHADAGLADKVESALFNYETNLYSQQFEAKDIDEIVRSSIEESGAILNQMAQAIDLAISSFDKWTHPVTIEACTPKEGWIVSEAKIKVGDAFKGEFEYLQDSNGFRVGEVRNEGLPPSLTKDFQGLLDKLKENPRYNRILTLYMSRPLTECRYFEIAKRDLSLGIESVLPKHVVLTNIPVGDNDIWKVRVEERFLRECTREGQKEYKILEDEAPLKWIELFQKG